MSPTSVDASQAIRADLATAHDNTLTAWSRPGNGWTGTQRIAIVNEVRAARAADPTPPPWYRPSNDGDHANSPTQLPGAAIDVTWRLANHPGTLTDAWHADVAGDLTPGHYVELVSIVASACAIDVFAEAIGAHYRDLPTPTTGEPDDNFAPDATISSHWVPTVGDSGPMVGRALTMSPNAVETWRRLSEAQYVPWHALVGDLSYSRGALDRMQVELLAARTSLLNECFY